MSGAPCSCGRPSSSVASIVHAGRLPLVGVGGILRGGDAYAKIRAGASALQLYTALVYRPRVVSRILAELDQLLALDGVARLEDARGADVET